MEKLSQEVKNFFTTRNLIIILIVVILLIAIGCFSSHREGRRNMMYAQGRGFSKGGMMFEGRGSNKKQNFNKADFKNGTDVQKIMEAKDYQTFSNLASGTFLGSKINTPELFAKFLEMQQNLTKANTIGATLGLPGMNTGNNMIIFGRGQKNMVGGDDCGYGMMRLRGNR